MKFCAVTLGCKVNQFETHAIESILNSRGHTRADAGQGCDICIINTCAVTAESVRKSRQAVRRIKRLEPTALIVVSGCLSQIQPEKTAQLGADIVAGSGNRQGLADEIERLFRGKKWECQTIIDDPFLRDVFEELTPGTAAGRTRSMLKIQDGCDNFCTYCVVPYARGRSRSLPVSRAVLHAKRLADEGFREIIITGIEICSYGKDLRDATTLTGALREIGKAAPMARIRLGSLDPAAITEEFCLELSATPNLCGHFHLSLQSGCDGTLRRMGRNYVAGDALAAISRLRELFPDCGITADLIVGFPGETDAEFEETMGLIITAAFSDMHIFPFSPRPGTPAAVMKDQVEKSARRERARIAATAAAEMARDFRLSQVGKSVEVLFERKRGGYSVGHSGNYLEVAVKNGVESGGVHTVRITDAPDKLVLGEIVC